MGNLLSLTFVAGLIMLAMYLIYKWALSTENTYSFNRKVILSIYILSPIIALAGRYMSHGSAGPYQGGEVTMTDLLDLLFLNAAPDQGVATGAPLWPKIAIAVWITGMVIFLGRMIAGTIKLRRIVSSGERVNVGKIRLIIVDDNNISPFSTRNSIVMNRTDYESSREMIITHEMAHIRCNHWLDLVLAQAVCIVCWFNPASWLLAEELKSVHEYQADMAVLQNGADARQYQMLLIKKAVGKSFPAIANSLNHSKLKKRITMMLKSKQEKNHRMRVLALAPAAALALLVTNLPVIASGLSTVGQADLTTASTTDKGSEKSGNSTTATAGQITMIRLPKNDAEQGSGVTVDPTAGSSEKYSVLINGEKFEGDINSIPSDQVASMDIIKTDGGSTVNIITNKKDNEKVSVAAQELPKFPGGEKAMLEWLKENTEYPASVKYADMPENVRVVVKFVVNKDGEIVNPEIIRSGGEAYNAEALKVIGKMPKWTPGTVKGEPVDVNYTLPISFKKPAPDAK